MLLLLAILTLASGFFSGSEAAIFSQDASRLLRMRSEEIAASLRKTVLGWLRRPERVITGLLLGNLIVNIALTDLWESWFAAVFGDFPQKHMVLPLLITLYVLAFGEVVPKVIALNFHDHWIRLFEVPLQIWLRISARITTPLDHLTAKLTKPIKVEDTPLGEVELIEAVRFAEDHGLIKSEETRMLSRAIAFYHNTLYTAMIPRSQLLLLPQGISLARARRAFLDSAHDFAAIYQRNSNRIVGVVYLRGIVQLQLAGKKNIATKIFPVDFLPASFSLSAALSALIAGRRNIAAVIDEAGTFIGMVTLRGITNHILGASFAAVPQDAHLEKLDRNRYRVAAQMPLDRFNEIFRTQLSGEHSETIGGYIVEILDGFPRREDSVRIGKLVFSDFVMEEHRLRHFTLTVKNNNG
ncbi:MAG: CNNM domain-containing protein [Turneriella sp.]|nr:CNNM domain-containing protein [Leptospiraceae bacterium]MCX7631994.1 CNNM domain-containing protein [Turneriella sp.]